MYPVVRPIRLALVAVSTIALLAVASTMQAAVGLAATHLVGGTLPLGHHRTDQDVMSSKIPWITAMTDAAPPPPISVVHYPASFWPISSGGLSDPTFGQSVTAGVDALPSPESVQPGTVFAGGSQGAVVISMYKRKFNDTWASEPEDAPAITLVLVENPMRPDGGILERLKPLRKIPILDIPFYGATPTQTAGAAEGEITTYDVAFQYNVFCDFPTNPLFILSVINSLFPVSTVDPAKVQDAVLQGEYGDTRYYMVPTYPVPILKPLNRIPKAGPVLADMLDPAVRLLVEAGYDRTVSPGQPTKAELGYFPNPTTLARNLLIAVPTGLDNGVEDIRGVRPFGTQRPDVMGQEAYGINGPPVTLTQTTTATPPTGAQSSTRKASTSRSLTTHPIRPKLRAVVGSDRSPKARHAENERHPLHRDRHLTGKDTKR